MLLSGPQWVQLLERAEHREGVARCSHSPITGISQPPAETGESGLTPPREVGKGAALPCTAGGRQGAESRMMCPALGVYPELPSQGPAPPPQGHSPL